MIHATKWRRKQNGGENKMAAKTKWWGKLLLVTEAQRNIFGILLNQAQIILYLPCTD